MQLPEIKFNTKKFGLNAVLTTSMLLILAYEAYFAFNYIYKNFLSVKAIVDETTIVRLDTPNYRKSVEYLSNLDFYIPNNPIPINSNPFK